MEAPQNALLAAVHVVVEECRWKKVSIAAAGIDGWVASMVCKNARYSSQDGVRGRA